MQSRPPPCAQKQRESGMGNRIASSFACSSEKTGSRWLRGMTRKAPVAAVSGSR